MNNIKLDPICFKNFPMEINNLGYLLPCCYCDENENLKDPKIQKLLSVSKLDEHETIEEIVFSKEWKEFEENLRNHEGPLFCIRNCKITEENEKTITRADTWINVEDGTVLRERSA
jgi:hypothetical protein